MKILKLGTIVSDTVSGTKGMLTHCCINMQENDCYIYQPAGLNPKTGQPVTAIMVDKARIKGASDIEVVLPLEVLGSTGEDTASGFKGTIIGLTYHINGCVHVEIKPKGTTKETGSTIESHEFDIRRIKGSKIKMVTSEKLAKSIKETPSPMQMPSPKYKR